MPGMQPQRKEHGFTLVESLVAIALAGVIAIALVPVVLLAIHTSSMAGELTDLTAHALNRVEHFTSLPFNDAGLVAGGSLEESLEDYSLDPLEDSPRHYVRWKIVDESMLMKRISVLVGVREVSGEAVREVRLETFRTSMQ